MESGGSSRSRLLTAGGILSIIGGALAVMAGGAGVGLNIANMDMVARMTPPSMYTEIYTGMIRGMILAASFFAVGIVAILGGESAIKRKNFGLSLAGAICALSLMTLGWYIVGSAPAGMFFSQPLAMAISGIALVILGILAVIFIALRKREFRAKVKEDGI
jgi:predicted small integral membrane protein